MHACTQKVSSDSSCILAGSQGFRAQVCVELSGGLWAIGFLMRHASGEGTASDSNCFYSYVDMPVIKAGRRIAVPLMTPDVVYYQQIITDRMEPLMMSDEAWQTCTPGGSRQYSKDSSVAAPC